MFSNSLLFSNSFQSAFLYYYPHCLIIAFTIASITDTQILLQYNSKWTRISLYAFFFSFSCTPNTFASQSVVTIFRFTLFHCLCTANVQTHRPTRQGKSTWRWTTQTVNVLVFSCSIAIITMTLSQSSSEALLLYRHHCHLQSYITSVLHPQSLY